MYGTLNIPVLQHLELSPKLPGRAVQKLTLGSEALKFDLIVVADLISDRSNLVTRKNLEDATFSIFLRQLHLRIN